MAFNLNKIFLKILPVLIFILVGVVIYSNTFHSRFQFDDLASIVNSPFIRDVTNLSTLRQAFGTPVRVVAAFSFALNYHFHQLDVFGYHLTNFIIHIITTCLVWWFVKLILSTPRLKSEAIASNKEVISFVCALIFLTHPVQTQAITYITQRLESLASLFYMATVCFYLKARITTARPLGKSAWFFMAGVWAVFGMFTKEIVITVPLNIILMECLLLKTSVGKKHWLLVAPFILLGGFIIPSFFSFNVVGILSGTIISESHAGDVITFGKYFLTQFRVCITFLRLLFIPLGQNPDYDFPLSRSLFEPSTFFSFLVFVSMIVAAIKLRSRHVLISFGIFWFLIVFAPNQFVPRANIIAEHKLYLLSVGFCIALVAALWFFLKDAKKFIVVGIGIVLIFSCVTFGRNKVWKNEISLWSDTVKKSPRKSRPLVNLGKAYVDYGRPDLAKGYYDKAIEVNPKSYRAYNNRGLWYFRQKKYSQAMIEYDKALEINPNYFYAVLNRGVLYGEQGRYNLALIYFHRAVLLKNWFTLLHFNIANTYAKGERYARAIDSYSVAIRNKMNYPDVYRNRGNAYKMQGKFDLAIQDYNKALEIDSTEGITYFHRSLAYQAKGNILQALKDAHVALSLGYRVDPRYLRMLQNSYKKLPDL